MHKIYRQIQLKYVKPIIVKRLISTTITLAILKDLKMRKKYEVGCASDLLHCLGREVLYYNCNLQILRNR